MTWKEVTIGSAKYAVVATIATIIGNVFLAPKLGYAKPSLDSMVTLGLFGLIGTFFFFLIVFFALNRLNKDGE